MATLADNLAKAPSTGIAVAARKGSKRTWEASHGKEADFQKKKIIKERGEAFRLSVQRVATTFPHESLKTTLSNIGTERSRCWTLFGFCLVFARFGVRVIL